MCESPALESPVAGSLIPGPVTCGWSAEARISGREPGRASSAEPGMCQMLGWALAVQC